MRQFAWCTLAGALVTACSLVAHGADYRHSGRMQMTSNVEQSGGVEMAHAGLFTLSEPVTQSGTDRQHVGTLIGAWPGSGRSWPAIADSPTTLRLAFPRRFGPEARFGLWASTRWGVSYQLQRSTNLVQWTRVLDFVGEAGATDLQDSLSPSGAAGFYRVVEVSD